MYIYQIMSNTFGYIDIILLAMIAGFIILRLRNILGRKTGHENKAFSGYPDKKFEEFNKQNIKSKTDTSETLEGSEKKGFLEGAAIAYESIINAFAKEDVGKLKTLLTSNMALSFEEAIAERKKNKIKSELTFIGMKESKLEKFDKVENEIYATVKFVSEIISVKKDKDNVIIEGNPDKIKTVTDHWKFTKNALSQNPNWYLSEIISQ